MSVLVSIVTVSFNSEKTIKDTIESVLNQTYKNIEYIIVDGLSNDHTIEIAQSYSRKFNEQGIPFTIISEKDQGIYDAMNKGIMASRGELIGLINSDDWYEVDAVEKVIKTYEQEKFDYFFADLLIVNGVKKTIKHANIKKHYVSSKDWNHPTSFVTKELYNKYQYLNKTIYDDFDFYLKIRKAGYKIYVLNETIANFRFGGISNEKNLKKAFERMKQRYVIYKSNGYSRLYIMECIGIELIKLLIA